MAVPDVLDKRVQELIPDSKILVVGAGGIGCEILKNLALSGFRNIEIIDLDTIDVSNLNRQFLFRKEHVGKSKATVAKESIVSLNPDIKIKAYHDSITTSEYGINFYRRFKLVLNALDNRAARNHVNRMCLASCTPLIESGTAGYTGQVELIQKGLTQCYECQPKPPQKTFPGCTIRNTPSEPVHCIVWAKHLFNQLFGESDPDQDVSPDTADPEAAGDAGQGALDSVENKERTSTHQWAQDCDYDPKKLFNKFFSDDIKYLLSMGNLWKSRRAPTVLSWDDATTQKENDTTNTESVHKEDMQVWSIKQCAEVFASSMAELRMELKNRNFLVWDKDDKPALNFVTACANIRSHIFGIVQKSRFDIKSIAGNIIPAIATTNAMVAGLVVLLTFRVLANDFENCQTIYVRQKSSVSKTVMMAESSLLPANPSCYVCAPKPFVTVSINTKTMTVKEFEDQILKHCLNMIAPDVVLDGKGVVVISSEEGETEINNNKVLTEVSIVDGAILKVDDFLQNYELTIYIDHFERKRHNDPFYKIFSDMALKGKGTRADADDSEDEVPNGKVPADKMEHDGEDGDDLLVVEAETLKEDDPQEGSSKKRKPNPPEEDDDLIMLDE